MNKRCLTVVSVIIVLAVVWIMVDAAKSPDDSQVDNSDLRVERRNIPAEQNAYTYFCLATNTLYRADEQRTNVEDQIEGGLWPTNLVEEILQKNVKTFEFIEKGLECNSCEVPDISSIDTPIPYVRSWRDFGRLMSLRTKAFFRMGKERQAFESAMATMRLGHTIEGCNGSVICYLVGVAVKRMGLCDMEKMVRTTSLPSSTLVGYSRTIASFRANEDGLGNALKTEYRIFCGLVDRVLKGQNPLFGKTGDRIFRLSAGSYLFNVNKTKATYAGIIRVSAQDASKDYSSMKTPSVEESWEPLRRSLFKPNSIGKMFIGMSWPSLGSALRRECQERTFVDCLRLVLCLKAYRQDTAMFPSSLEQLVPAYINQVPSDPFDGHSMRYSSDKRIVYSVGDNLKDDGGLESVSRTNKDYNTGRWRNEDIVFHLDF